jgi:histidine ammonia-lyase
MSAVGGGTTCHLTEFLRSFTLRCVEKIELRGVSLTIEQVGAIAAGKARAVLAGSTRSGLERSRNVIEQALARGQAVYGVNTGFGRLANVRIPSSELEDLQLNLVRSHACGVGRPLPEDEARAVMLLRANTLAMGYSGVRVELLEHVLAMLEHGIVPVIPEKGSVGASGDLAPLAHLALAIIGEGEVTYQNQSMPAAEAFRRASLRTPSLKAKEGLALLNGTQAMAGVGALAVLRAERLAGLADVAGAMSLEALRGTPVPFDERIQAVRPHAGQQKAAAHLRSLLTDSAIRQSHLVNDARVQDAYSLRCMPQVHGAVRDVLAHARAVLEVESGSATDNPLVFADSGEVLSGGNFHGAPLAYALDYAAIAVTDLASMSERRIARLVHPDLNEGLPPFLTAHPGVASGFMAPQIVAAALLSELKVLAHPASIDNVPTSGDQEDHVSMGMTAATKLRSIVDNAERIFAIEMLTAAEGLEYRAPLRPGRGVQEVVAALRARVPRLTADRSLAPDIEGMAESIRTGQFDQWAVTPAEA